MRLALLCLVTLAVGAADEPAKGGLDGKTFTIEIASSEGEKTADVLTFEAGVLRSQTYQDMKFGASKYQASGKGDQWTFSAVMENAGRGGVQAGAVGVAQAVWNGKISGATISGTVVVKTGSFADKSTFTGTAGAAPAK